MIMKNAWIPSHRKKEYQIGIKFHIQLAIKGLILGDKNFGAVLEKDIYGS